MHSKLPNFAGQALSIQPPFYFKNMTACVFPLRAQLDSLQRLCDNYLNIIPPELGHFRASVPYVYLMMLDYGRLAVEATNLGWFAQREVMFCVPVEWYKVEDGEWVFQDWATVAPFIYVDDALSMTLGRTVLGWPKSLVKLAPQLTGWMQDPGGSTLDAAMTAKVFPKAYAGQKMSERIFMKVHSSPLSSLQMPPNMTSSLMPWSVMSNVMQAAAGYAMDYLGLLKGMGLMPLHQGSSAANFGRMAQRAAAMGFPLAPNLSANTLNLKQFRRADKPVEYCYQALTNGPMRFTAFNRGAMLGESGIMTGDHSGGYSIDLVRWPEFPIVETLGLQVAEHSSTEGVEVARLKPVLPFWYDVDMQYEQGHRIAWRADDGIWRDPDGKTYPAETESANKRFNTSLGAGTRVMTGPFHFPSANLRVLPLLSRVEKLQGVLDRVLNVPLGEAEPGRQQFRVWAPAEASAGAERLAYVYLVVKDWGDVSSETNDIGDWADMGSAFYIPVRRYLDDKFVGVGLVPTFALADGTTQSCTLSELYGIPTMEAEFRIAPGAWGPGDTTSAEASHTLLEVDAEILPTLGEGQETQHCRILDFEHGGGRAFSEVAELSEQAEAFCLLLHDEITRKQGPTSSAKEQRTKEKTFGRELALELLTGGRQLHIYTLKEFRDGATPTNACYQALVRVPYLFESIKHIEEIRHIVRVKVHEYPSLPIVEALGLVYRERSLQQGGRIFTVEALRPFHIHASLGLGNGERLRHRVDEHWHVAPDDEASPEDYAAIPPLPDPPLSLQDLAGQLQEPRGDSARVERAAGLMEADTLEARVSRNFPCYLNRTMAQWRKHQGLPPGPCPELDQGALAKLENLNLQAVLESVLAREWEDRSSTAERTRARAQLAREIESQSSAWGAGLSQLDKKLRLLEGRGWTRSETAKELVAELRPIEELFRALLAAVDEGELALAQDLEARRSFGAHGSKPQYALHHWNQGRDRVTDIIADLLNPEKAKNLRRPGDYVLTNSLDKLQADHRRNCRYSDEQFLSEHNPKFREDCAWGVHRLLEVLYRVGERVVDDAIDDVIASLRWPDHRVLRSTAGRERERIFPSEFSLRDTWYVGPRPGDVATSLPTALPRQSQPVKEDVDP